MLARWTHRLPVFLPLCVAPAALAGQSATVPLAAHSSVLPPNPGFRHHKELHALYDSVADSTHLAVVTHKGKYFLTIQRPRLTWSTVYAGHTPATPPPEVVLEFRTQSPQVALDSRLVIESDAGQRLEVTSAGARSEPGVLTWSHFMRFPVPTAALASVLATDDVTVSVGGISERLRPEHVNALRDLLSRAGAWPTEPSVPGGA